MVDASAGIEKVRDRARVLGDHARREARVTLDALGKMLKMLMTDLEGEPGFWHGTRDEAQVFVLADEPHDRMRLMSLVGEVQEKDAEFFQLLLGANFDRALDARYAMRGDELWSVSVHPLATLAPDDVGSYLDQVVRLVKNTGTTYASTDLVFRSLSDEDDEAGSGDDEADEDEEKEGMS